MGAFEQLIWLDPVAPFNATPSSPDDTKIKEFDGLDDLLRGLHGQN